MAKRKSLIHSYQVLRAEYWALLSSVGSLATTQWILSNYNKITTSCPLPAILHSNLAWGRRHALDAAVSVVGMSLMTKSWPFPRPSTRLRNGAIHRRCTASVRWLRFITSHSKLTRIKSSRLAEAKSLECGLFTEWRKPTLVSSTPIDFSLMASAETSTLATAFSLTVGLSSKARPSSLSSDLERSDPQWLEPALKSKLNGSGRLSWWLNSLSTKSTRFSNQLKEAMDWFKSCQAHSSSWSGKLCKGRLWVSTVRALNKTTTRPPPTHSDSSNGMFFWLRTSSWLLFLWPEVTRFTLLSIYQALSPLRTYPSPPQLSCVRGEDGWMEDFHARFMELVSSFGSTNTQWCAKRSLVLDWCCSCSCCSICFSFSFSPVLPLILSISGTWSSLSRIFSKASTSRLSSQSPTT